MPQWRSFENFRDAMGDISNAAVKYIEKKQQERQRERQFGAMKGYLTERYNRAATPGTPDVGARAGTPDTPGQIGPRPISPAGQPYAGPMEPGPSIRGMAPTAAQPGTPPTAGRDVGPEVEMLRQMGLAPEAAMQEIRGRYTPKYTQFTGPQGELDQFQVDAEGNRVVPGTRESLRAPIPKPAPPAKKTIDRVVGRDGYYYDVVENPMSGETEYRRSNIRAPAKERPGDKTEQKEHDKAIARVHTLTAKNQELGQKMRMVDAKIAPSIKAFGENSDLAKGYREQAQLEKDGYQAQIDSNEQELNDLNEQIGGTWRSGGPETPQPGAATGDKAAKAKKFLDEQGYDSSDESVKTFLKNNPHF
jgi:hypothetical protein